ncbi:hypothetical protein BH11PSE9_BH11PSE9_02610 [soil metagenome]
MKNLRLFILVLLAVLLPVRGAMAAAMMCGQGEGTHAVAVAEHSSHHSAGGDAADDGRSPDHPSDHHPANCHLSASGCCMASMLGTFPALAQPAMTASVVFPTLTAPLPAFHSDGQERPPRTI